jgi:hypothetical protein
VDPILAAVTVYQAKRSDVNANDACVICRVCGDDGGACDACNQKGTRRLIKHQGPNWDSSQTPIHYPKLMRIGLPQRQPRSQ